VAGIRDEDALAAGVREHLPRAREQRSGLTFGLAAGRQGSGVEFARSLMLAHDLTNGPVQEVVAVLTRDLPDYRSLRGDEHHGGPGLDGVGAPQQQLHVAHHRMSDALAHHRLSKARRVGLLLELGGVNSDHRQAASVLPLEPRQVAQQVLTPDAPGAEEVQQHDLPAQVAHAQGPIHIQPLQPLGEVRRRRRAREPRHRGQLRRVNQPGNRGHRPKQPQRHPE
jgi:hypothetical protein